MALSVNSSSLTPLDKAFLNRATQIAEAYLHDVDFTVASFCRMMGYSRSQTYRRVRELTGHSPSRFITRRRLERAARMLKEEPLTIREIAGKAGFKSRSYFGTCFKEYYGVTPGEYR
ncbi:helix-turn-helix transcriptional regulator [bacterium]|nr:helix-turn-helix transcriptional regulator [bacterium]